MKQRLQQVISFLLLTVFLWPTLAKLEHHHEHHDENSQAGTAIEKTHHKCAICNFEFSFFADPSIQFKRPDYKPVDSYLRLNTCPKYSNRAQYSFLLRAPPII